MQMVSLGSTHTRTSTRMSGYHPMAGLGALRACRSGLRPLVVAAYGGR